MLLQWQREFEVGHRPTDLAHRAVVDLLNELDESLAVGAPQEVVERLLGELNHLLTEHLESGHDALERLCRGEGPDSRHDLKLLAHWWLAHLCGQDPVQPCPPTKPPSH